MVAVGTLISAFWILSVNSWMQTPAGYAINADGQFVPRRTGGRSSSIRLSLRLVHTVLAAYLTTAFVGRRGRRLAPAADRTTQRARMMFSMAMWMAAIVAPMQIFVGDLHGLNTLEHQPAKVMAMEGHYREPRPDGAPLDPRSAFPTARRARSIMPSPIPNASQPDPEARPERAAAGPGHHSARGLARPSR